jgi:mannose-6-phosphate isomerase-like protein (cupin superfamily)
MRRFMLAGLLLVGPIAFAQTPAPKPAAPAPLPAPVPAPAPRRPAAPPARAGLAITVTDPRGVTLSDVHVQILGTTDRSGDTNASGQLSLPGLQAGTYRLRFSGDSVITFEKEITLRAGQIADVDVMLNAAPPKPEPPPPPPPPPAAPPSAPSVGPVGQPQALSIVDLVERELISNNQPRRETLVSCSGNTRTTLVQLNQDQPQRLYDTAEINYYVVAGEGAVRLNGRDTAIAAGSLVSLPRETPHALIRRGRRPLIILVTLSGVPCEEAK